MYIHFQTLWWFRTKQLLPLSARGCWFGLTNRKQGRQMGVWGFISGFVRGLLWGSTFWTQCWPFVHMQCLSMELHSSSCCIARSVLMSTTVYWSSCKHNTVGKWARARTHAQCWCALTCSTVTKPDGGLKAHTTLASCEHTGSRKALLFPSFCLLHGSKNMSLVKSLLMERRVTQWAMCSQW